jgi:hypothetical protein
MATVAAPEKPQHMVALELANDARSGAARVRREVKAGRMTLQQAVADPDSGPLQALTLVMELPRWGRESGRRALRAAGVPDTKRVRDFTDRQRAAIVTQVCGQR